MTAKDTKKTWTVVCENDVGLHDDGFWQWWEVTDNNRVFKSDEEDDAKWLCDFLNSCTKLQ